jgi:hypothetical protein
MPEVLREHFVRAAADIGAHGDNDTLPFDVDTRFISTRQPEIAGIAFDFFQQLQGDSVANSKNRIGSFSIFADRLLVPAGPSGFRISTKIHPFWNLYLNGLGVAIADAIESDRDRRTYSYRFRTGEGPELFDRAGSWRAFREATSTDAAGRAAGTMVVQTDISGFYEHISHHHVENSVNDVFPENARVATQINALLGKLSAGRSFGMPVGSQASRVLAELFLSYVDRRMTAAGISWYRYVDDYVLIADSNAAAYGALATLSHALADYGLTLSKTKTVFLTARHYSDYVATQLGLDDEEAGRLREIDLHFDPYSDTAIADYESLKTTVEAMEVQKLLNRELEKAIPDSFLVTQIGRTLRLHEPGVALQLVTTLLSPGNLHAFRASWSTIMRGVANETFAAISGRVDLLLDAIPVHSAHLLEAESSVLHFLRALRFQRTAARSAFVLRVYNSTRSETVRRGCIDCWRHWRDRDGFTLVRNRWNDLSVECQRLLWLASFEMGDQGDGFRRQVGGNIRQAWRLGIERQGAPSYFSTYEQWCDEASARV